jgi:hypothetical protein
MLATIFALLSLGSTIAAGVSLILMRINDPLRLEYKDFRRWEREIKKDGDSHHRKREIKTPGD